MGVESEPLRSAEHVVVVPNHSLGCDVASFVRSKAAWRYETGSGGEVGLKDADSTSRARKWRIRRDQRLFGVSIRTSIHLDVYASIGGGNRRTQHVPYPSQPRPPLRHLQLRNSLVPGPRRRRSSPLLSFRRPRTVSCAYSYHACSRAPKRSLKA